ncbi:MAG: hypothetical protein EA392_13605 [Cryomorphaceae bacterium]|nr:MAG: hypothetical protein EA392_13605 [Cryomorphaceae bacterium]
MGQNGKTRKPGAHHPIPNALFTVFGQGMPQVVLKCLTCATKQNQHMDELYKILVAGGLILALIVFAKVINKRHENKKKRKNR